MSYDLICWRSRAPVRAPIALGAALKQHELDADVEGPRFTLEQARDMVTALEPKAIAKAFRAEFGDLQVTATQIIAPTFLVGFSEYYFEIDCRWSVTEATLVQLRRAALRARCSTWDRQIEQLFEPTEFI